MDFFLHHEPVVRFEPFVMYRYVTGPRSLHSVWGEFKPIPTEAGSDPQVAAMATTLEALRRVFPTAILFLQDDPPPDLPSVAITTFETPFIVAGHNGPLIEYKPLRVHLLDVKRESKVDYPSLVSQDRGAAWFFSARELTVERLRQEFEGARSLGALEVGIHSLVSAYVGFDHDAFFTFESHDPDLVEEVLKAAHLSRPR